MSYIYAHIDGTIMAAIEGLHIEFESRETAQAFLDDMAYYIDLGAVEIDGDYRHIYQEIRRRKFGDEFAPPAARNNRAL